MFLLPMLLLNHWYRIRYGNRPETIFPNKRKAGVRSRGRSAAHLEDGLPASSQHGDEKRRLATQPTWSGLFILF